MMLTLSQIDHGALCHGWSWAVLDEDELPDRVARIVLGQYRHVAKILQGGGVPGPIANADQARAAIEQLTLGPGEDPWQRDGWIFQAISWIAAHQAPSGALTRAPHIRKSDKGFDGLQLELSEDGTAVTAVIVFEDKATDNARDTIRDDVWPGVVALESGKRLNELTHEVSAILDARALTGPKFDIDTAIANTGGRTRGATASASRLVTHTMTRSPEPDSSRGSITQHPATSCAAVPTPSTSPSCGYGWRTSPIA
jgi:hypothetical protein